MFQPLRIKPVAVEYSGYVPTFFKPLLRAARQGDDLVPTIDQITKELGFDTFTCHGKHERPPELRVDAVRLYYYAARVGSSLRSALIHRG